MRSRHFDERGEEGSDIVDGTGLLKTMGREPFVIARRNCGLGNELEQGNDLQGREGELDGKLEDDKVCGRARVVLVTVKISSSHHRSDRTVAFGRQNDTVDERNDLDGGAAIR